MPAKRFSWPSPTSSAPLRSSISASCWFWCEKTIDEDRGAGPRDVKVVKYSKRPGQRPEVKTLRVLGNQRLTVGGQVKRAKKVKQISVKKRSQT